MLHVVVVQELQAGESLRTVCFAKAIATGYALLVPLPMLNNAPCQNPDPKIGRASAFSDGLRSGTVHDLILDLGLSILSKRGAMDRDECSRPHARYPRAVKLRFRDALMEGRWRSL